MTLFAARMSFATAALIAGLAGSVPAHAQDVTEAQKSAIRSNCRSDFMSKCSSVTPGGAEAFQCLKKNEASLSGGCRAAVSAIKLPGEAPAAAAPAPSPQPAPAAAAPKPTEAKAAVPEPAKPVAPKPTQAKPATAPKPAVAAAPAAPAPVAAPTPPGSQPKPVTLSEAILVRRFCTTDYQVLCKGTPLGGGRVIKCLSDNQPALSPNCKGAIAKAQ